MALQGPYSVNQVLKVTGLLYDMPDHSKMPLDLLAFPLKEACRIGFVA